MPELSLRDKAKVILEREIAVRHMELLLQQNTIKQRDADFIDRVYNILSRVGQVARRRSHKPESEV